jgi:hypothetical protein
LSTIFADARYLQILSARDPLPPRCRLTAEEKAAPRYACRRAPKSGCRAAKRAAIEETDAAPYQELCFFNLKFL